ncbi:MAG TPA: hypothetical protein VN783_13645 [Thermoanaerobaculia bacterium]|nr:hypothetical protein [Thermoanaerobaculia bacterium]
MPPSETPHEPRRSPLPALLACALAVCLGYFAAEAYVLSGDFGFPLDDSWIHLQFARSLASGHGLAYNPGELVTGSTAPLWTALLALLFHLPGSVVLWTKALGVALHLAGVWTVWRLARELGLRPASAVLAAAFMLATSWLAWSALSGMEIPLFVFLSTGAIGFHLRERRNPARPPLSLGLFGLSILARPEGAFLLVLAVLDRLLVSFARAEDGALVWRPARPRPWRPVLVGLGLAACAVAGPVLFYKLVGGSFLPTTYSAKGGDLRRLVPDVQYAAAILGILFRAQPWLVLASGAGVLALVERLGTPRDRGLLPALWLLGLPLAYSTMSPIGRGILAGNFGRYYFPLLPIVAILGVLGLERAGEALGPRLHFGAGGSLGSFPLRAALLALLAWPTLAELARGPLQFAQNVANVQDSDVEIARYLAPRLPPEATLAVNDIGAIKFLLPNRIVDLVGIASPEVRTEVAGAVRHGVPFEQAMLAAIDRRRPDYLIVFPSWFPVVERDARFRLVGQIEIPNNITMGDARLGLWATPWTRYPLRRLPGDPEPGGSLDLSAEPSSPPPATPPEAHPR